MGSKSPKPRNRAARSPRKPPPAWRNALTIGLMTLLFGIALGGPIGGILEEVNVLTGALILIVTIGVAILADIVAVAATAGTEAPFNAMASKKVPGAREALVIVRNAGRVNSLLGDVIGDIAGTISGVVSGPIIFSLQALYPAIPDAVVGMAVIGIVTSVTVAGKAAEKGFAVRASTSVILLVGKAIHYTKRIVSLGRRR